MYVSPHSPAQETSCSSELAAATERQRTLQPPATDAAPTRHRSQHNRAGLSAGDNTMRGIVHTPAPETESSVLNLGGTIAAPNRHSGASSHPATYVFDGRHEYRVKFNHHGAVATFHEILAARMNRLLFPGRIAPEVKFGSDTAAMPDSHAKNSDDYCGVAIASRMVPGFQDWGDFLIWHKKDYAAPEESRACSALAHVAPEHREEYLALLRAHCANRQNRAEKEASIGSEHPEMQPYLAKPKTDYTRLSAEVVARFEPLRRFDAAALDIEDRMLDLLPPAFRTALQQALYETEAIGNWDFANHERANVGPVIQDGRLIGATVIDFGVCGPMGFSGARKEHNSDNVTRAARLDDPCLHLGESDGELKTVPAYPYPSGQLLDIGRVIDASDLSRSADPLPLLPRSGSYRILMKNVMPDQREYGKLPAPMLKTAFRLSQVAPEEIRHLIQSVWDECVASGDPGVIDMLRKVEASGDSVDTLSRLYQTRRANLVERAGEENLRTWALRNPEKSREAMF